MSLVRFRFWAFYQICASGRVVLCLLAKEKVAGSIPVSRLLRKERSLILQASFLYDDLLANWALLEKGEKTFTIEPLK